MKVANLLTLKLMTTYPSLAVLAPIEREALWVVILSPRKAFYVTTKINGVIIDAYVDTCPENVDSVNSTRRWPHGVTFHL